MSKEPFEKIRSLVERKRLFNELVDKRVEIVCKGADDSLFAFFPQKLLNEMLIVGEIRKIEQTPRADTEILGNFSIEDDRYFLTGPLKVTQLEGVLHINSDLYKLQRRQSHRVTIPPEMNYIFSVTSIDGETEFLSGKFHDISVGGARIYFPPAELAKSPKGPPRLVGGGKLTGVIHAPSGKNIEVEAEIKHLLKGPDGQPHYGIEIKMDKVVVKNRLMSLVMDIQHKVITSA